MVGQTKLMKHEQRGEISTAAILENLTTRMTRVLTQNQTQTPTTTYHIVTAQISIKLDGTNYAL